MGWVVVKGMGSLGGWLIGSYMGSTFLATAGFQVSDFFQNTKKWCSDAFWVWCFTFQDSDFNAFSLCTCWLLEWCFEAVDWFIDLKKKLSWLCNVELCVVFKVVWVLGVFQALLERNRTMGLSECSTDSDTTHANTHHTDKPKHFYKLWWNKEKFVKIRFDRLALLALLDKYVTFFFSSLMFWALFGRIEWVIGF